MYCHGTGAIQGYFAYKITPPPRTLLYAQGPRGVLGGWAFSYERGTPVPQLYLTFYHLLTHAFTFPGSTFWKGTRWGMPKGLVDLLSRIRVQRTTLCHLGSWFLNSPLRFSIPAVA